MPRALYPAALLAVLLMVTPGALVAQRIAPPCSSSVWSAASTEAGPDSTHRSLAREGWTQSKGAATGGVIGALAGMAAGLWVCNRFGAGAGTSCGGNMVWGAALVGGLGLVLGSLAGAEAEGRSP